MNKALVVAILCLPSAAGAVGFIENPPNGGSASGIAAIAGWNCQPGRIEIVLDGFPPMLAGSGTDRLDTEPVCGRRDTGYSLLFNWGLLSPGVHTVRALLDGTEFARHTFTVASLGEAFLTGRAATIDVTDFPDAGKTTRLAWSQSQQAFVVQAVTPGAPGLSGRWNGANLESRGQCTVAGRNGNHGTYAQYDISLTANAITIAEATVTGLQCTYNGTYAQNGRDRQAAGRFTCSDGKQGAWQATSFLVAPRDFSIQMLQQWDTTETCQTQAVLSGSRF